MDCESLAECPFFHTLDSEAVDVLKEVYCHGNPTICARRMVSRSIGRENVPANLHPNHTHLVPGIIETALAAL